MTTRIGVQIQYAIFIKQFLAHIAFAKFRMIIQKKTNEALHFLQTTNHDAIYYEKVYRKILSECTNTNSCDIWNEVFAEHNIDIVLRYYMNIVECISSYSQFGNDPAYTYSPKTIHRNLYLHSANIYSPSDPPSSPKMFREFFEREHAKRIRNTIIYDAISLSTQTTAPLQKPFYTYLNQWKKHTDIKTNADGNLEITETILSKYTPDSNTYCELYTIWLIQIWLK